MLQRISDELNEQRELISVRTATRGDGIAQKQNTCASELELLEQRHRSINLVRTGVCEAYRFRALPGSPLLKCGGVLLELLPIDDAYPGNAGVSFSSFITRFIQIESDFWKRLTMRR